jgi:phosphoglycerate dehydrogenase-like enzyme
VPIRALYLSHATPQMYAILRESVPAGVELLTLDADSDQERFDKLKDSEVIIAAGHRLRADYIAAARNLKLVLHQGVGYHDTVDWRALRDRGIPLAITLEGSTVGVAEHTIMLMLALGKHLVFVDNELRQGRFHINSMRPYSFELAGKIIGYIGMGRIGQAVAARLKAFGTRGLYRDLIALTDARAAELGMAPASFEDVLTRADIVTLHVPLTPLTHHMIDAAALTKMKRDAVLINASRGPVVDENALCQALERGTIAGAALDVFEQEPLPANHPLTRLNNVILTPHTAAATRDALRTKMTALFANLQRFFRGEALANQVEFEPEGKAHR